ncbi:methyl-CpG-binding domain protein 5 isoform X2 [Tribolium castaneum]|uniref:PWWP domain-containing protein n=1 Tax=Tribolium castaneum TaxID=7070 RepID=D6W9F4_TRICA|nr:PREDICTED: methyl-CpG-binding domain protein 5 isoform X2 [Tribolium castaneum]EEZ98164.1 hypothetical protein TcasGA2_TC000591 [Tribolium castaneum]|eukprot:XP_971386.1 PREDICTED: methyl-CpG-binding domain protein 5 isoform X2 [Tribolium castaneum]
MAGKPELSPAPGVQNVVVYVSNDNFAQAYAVGGQNAPQYGPPKPYPEKRPDYPEGYFVSSNGYGYEERPAKECDYDPAYVTVMGAEGPPQSVRCDSVRSETAESSCSSLSSADEGMVLVQNNQPEMVVYDPSVSVRPGVVFVGAGVHHHPNVAATAAANLPAAQQPSITVPYGWKRILNNGSIMYISPSNTALSSPEQVKEYLLTSGTCKCGLECHFKYDNTFNFDPKVASKPWTLSPDTNTGDLTKLCNHKRKIIAMASLECKPPDPAAKMRKDCNNKKTKRKVGMPYAGCVSLSQIFTRPDKLALSQQHFNKEGLGNQAQVWPQSPTSSSQMGNRLQNYPESQQMVRYQNQEQQNRIVNGSPMVVGDNSTMMVPQQQSNISQQIHQNHNGQNPSVPQQHIIGPNGQVISLQGALNSNQVNNGVVIQGQNVVPNPNQSRVFINSQPSEPSGPGRPNIQMIPVGVTNQRDAQNRLHHFYNNQQYPQIQYDASKQMRPTFMPGHNQMNGFRPQNNQIMQAPVMINNHQKMPWPNRIQNSPNAYERVPPLHPHTPSPTMWQDEVKRKKVKLGKIVKNRPYHMMDSALHAPCPNIDVRQIPAENGRQVIINQNSASPSFMEDPSGYLAQQTALLNNTINRQTGVNACAGMVCSSPQQPHLTPPNSQTNEVPLPSNVVISHMKQTQNITNRTNQTLHVVKSQVPQVMSQQYNQMMAAHADSSVTNDQCQNCDSHKGHSRPNSQPGTPSSSAIDDPVTSSTYSDKQNNQSPDSRPIQGGTVSTSNVSPLDGSQSDPPTPNPHTPTPPRNDNMPYAVYQSREVCSTNYPPKSDCCSKMNTPYISSIVTTMASGRTVGSNTITSVLAGRANTATVSVNSPANLPASTTPTTVTQTVSKSPLEMVQSVVSSIQVPQSQTNPQISPPHIVKHSPTGLPPGHILVSSGGQLIMANTGNSQSGVMPPPPPKLVSNQTAMPPMSVSPMITNVTAAVSQVIPAVAQQVLGQQTVLVNALPTPFVLQGGVTMTMDGSMVGQNMQLPQIVAGNVIQQQIQLDNSDPRRTTALLSPETKKKGKKRKMSQTVANMLHIAAQQNSGVVMSQQGFPQQIQMAHSPQGLATGPVMQALTIVPSKTGGPPQIVMNGQPMTNTSPQLIANSQPAQQINLLQPVNLINGTTGVVQNFPTIQQFIVPNLGGMVMNPDGTATILQDTSNIGMQLQLQNVNGQNVLTPVQNNGMFNGGQSILAASPAGMVIRAPTSQGKLIQQQQHSPGAQFLSPNGGQFVVNGTQFSGQLSPLVASVSPSQQVTFGTSTPQIRPTQGQQEFIQCGQMGQTLMVPCAPTVAVSSSQNTTFVQQNTTIVQQQTTMVSNSQQLQNFQNNGGNRTTVNVDQNFIIANDNKQVQALVQVQRESPGTNYRQSVSTQTAVNQNAQTVTTFCQTSTLCAGSPPDTTTHSPLASGGQSPATADTTTHTGSTDDGLSPAPSNCSVTCDSAGRQPACTMAMVHCISSSEPDSADLNTQGSDHDWSRASSIPQQKSDLSEIHFPKKQNTPTHVAYAESSTMMAGLHFIGDQMKAQEAVVSSHNFDKIVQKRKSSDTLLVMETHHMHSSLFDEEEDNEKREKSEHDFVVGDLVWGPAKASPAWPGKIIQVDGNDVSVKWFGSEKLITKLDRGSLQTLTEGLDAHHQARKKCRTSRKLNSHLEKAIQEAMAELDKDLEQETKEVKQQKKKAHRVRSGHR